MLEVTITHIGQRWRHWGYYDWLLTGLDLLAAKGCICLKFELPPTQSQLEANPEGRQVLESPQGRELFGAQDWCLAGKAGMRDKSVTFAYDIHDAPHVFAWGYLEQCHVYFKCQHPADFDPLGFELSSQVRLPWHPDVFVFKDRIRPAMLGRPLSVGRSTRENLAVLERWDEARKRPRANRFLALYGSSFPVPGRRQEPGYCLGEPHDQGREEFLMSRPECLGRVEHPNLKRLKLLRWVKAKGFGEADVRFRDTDDENLRGDWFWGPNEYPAFACSTIYNLNVSGHARSIPFRFIDSFLAGATVVTDSLNVRWYRDFEPGVETVDMGQMGYEPDALVNWPRAWKLLEGLYEHARAHHARHGRDILDLYRRKWSPEALAAYVTEELDQALQRT